LKKKNDASTKVGDRLWYSPITCFKKYWHIIIIKHPEIFEKKKEGISDMFHNWHCLNVHSHVSTGGVC